MKMNIKELERQGIIESYTETKIPRCKICGCTDDHSCEGGCYWIAEGLCSSCYDKHQGYWNLVFWLMDFFEAFHPIVSKCLYCNKPDRILFWYVGDHAGCVPPLIQRLQAISQQISETMAPAVEALQLMTKSFGDLIKAIAEIWKTK